MTCRNRDTAYKKKPKQNQNSDVRTYTRKYLAWLVCQFKI